MTTPAQPIPACSSAAPVPSPPDGPAPRLIRRAGRAMASPLRLSIAPRDLPEDVASVLTDAAWTIVRGTFEVAEATMSRFREDSELTGLNRRAPEVTAISRPLERALAAADRARRVTGGRFDPRVLDALERIGYTGVSQREGAAARTSDAGLADGASPAMAGHREPVDRVFVPEGRSGTVTLPCPVDLGGIGKGLALRWAARALDASIVGAAEPPLGFLIDAGGDIVASGGLDDHEPWRVAIEDPGGGSEPVAVVALPRGGIATSSVRRLQWRHAGRTVHHLIDPRTGEPGGAGIAAVTVAGPDPAWAEVWSKALFLEGAAGIAGVARARGLAAWWVTADGHLEMTPAARLRTLWLRDEA